MPSFNSEKFITEAIESVLPQLTLHDEIIVQDGLSKDSTLRLLERFTTRDARIKVFSERDRGQSEALNYALGRASGDYVLWLNSDDIVLPGALKSIRATICEGNRMPGIVFGGHRTIRADGSVIAEYRPVEFSISKLLWRGCYVFSGSVAIDRELLGSVGGFSTEFDYCMDLELFLRLLSHTKNEPINCGATIGALRWHEESKTGSAGLRFVFDGWRARRPYVRTLSSYAAQVSSALVLVLSVISTPLRHSKIYGLIRGDVRK